MENKNYIAVTGQLVEVNVREGEKDGKRYIAGDLVVKVSETNLVQMKFYSSEYTQAGKVSKKYTSLQQINGLKDTRVKITGSFAGRMFYNNQAGQVTAFTELQVSFINPAKDTDVDSAIFDYSGYVHKPLTERMNKEEQLIGYEMEVGQADWSGELDVVKFFVRPEARGIAESIRDNYTKHLTVAFAGVINHFTTTETRTEEVAFGEPIVKVLPVVRKTYEITSGKQPIVSELAYTAEQISALESAYAQKIINVEREAKENASSSQAVVKPEPLKTSGVANLNSLL